MRNKNLGFGVFLLSIGILWLLFNFDILDWSVLSSVFTLWPLLLVMVGVNIIFRNNQIIKAVTWIMFLAVVILFGYFNQGSGGWRQYSDEWRQYAEKSVEETGNGNISVEKEEGIKNGKVKLDLGGVRLKVGSESTKLLDALVTNTETKHSIQYSNGGETADIRFYRNKTGVFSGEKFNEDFRLNLNRDVVWDLDVKIGAANGTLDLSDLKVKDLDIDTGAVNLELVFGANIESSKVKLDSGASKISVSLPEEIGVKVKFDAGLSKNNFKELGWEKQGNYYTSPNYDQAAKKIDFDVDMGVGQFEVNLGAK